MNKATVTALEHEDVYGKKQYYLKITHEDKTTFVNVGEKTFNNVKNLTKKMDVTMTDDTLNKIPDELKKETHEGRNTQGTDNLDKQKKVR